MSVSDAMNRDVAVKVEAVRRALKAHIDAGERLAVVKAPPGSGKTHLLLEAAVHARAAGLRVAIATQTNAQADDICRRLARDHKRVKVIRLSSKRMAPGNLGDTVTVETDAKLLPGKPCLVVGTAAKWGFATIVTPFAFVFIEEAWQLKWVDFMLLAQVSERFVLIGDPGQIPPVVTIDTSRWDTSPRAPHRAAPEVILQDPGISHLALSLPATRRLPYDTTALIRPFYEFNFSSLAGPGERAVLTSKKGRDAVDAAIDALGSGTAVGYTLPTPPSGPPLDEDEDVARAAVDVALRLLHRGSRASIDGKVETLIPEQIGLCATHHVMNAAMERLLPARLRGKLRVDTPERWQGLERQAMVVVHPLSGVTEPSAFDLETGRLCVMASRHRAGLIVVSRDHLMETLEEHLPVADQPIGRPDVSGRGHSQNLGFWTALQNSGRVIEGKA